MVGKEDVYKCINRLNKCLAYLAIVLEWTAIFSIFHLYNRNNDNHFSLLTSYTLVPISKCSTQKYLMTLKPIPPKLRESADVTWEDGSGKCDSGIFSSILTAPINKVGGTGHIAVGDTGICKEVNITKSFGVEFEKKHFGNSDYLTDYDERIDVKDRKLETCSRTKCEPLKFITCRLSKEYYRCAEEGEVGSCILGSSYYSDEMVEQDAYSPTMEYGEYLKRTVCSNLSHAFVVQKRNTSWEMLEKLHYDRRDYSTNFNDTDYYHVVSRKGAFLAISSPAPGDGDTHCMTNPTYVTGTHWIIVIYVFAKVLEVLILSFPDMRCLKGYRLCCFALLLLGDQESDPADDDDGDSDEFNSWGQIIFGFFNSATLYATCILPANIILPGLIEISDEHSAVMAGIDDALANDPGFVGPGIWHTESSLYTLVWNAGSWHIVFVLCLVIALIGVIPFCFRCQKSESEGCQKCVQYFSALAFLPIWAFYAIFTFLIIFDPMYKIAFAFAFPVEFSFEYGFPVPGLATRVAICAVSGALLKYLMLVLRILNAALGISIKLTA